MNDKILIGLKMSNFCENNFYLMGLVT